MSEPQKVRGMVLQASSCGEYDKRMVILTKEREKSPHLHVGHAARKVRCLRRRIRLYLAFLRCMREGMHIH